MPDLSEPLRASSAMSDGIPSARTDCDGSRAFEDTGTSRATSQSGASPSDRDASNSKPADPVDAKQKMYSVLPEPPFFWPLLLVAFWGFLSLGSSILVLCQLPAALLWRIDVNLARLWVRATQRAWTRLMALQSWVFSPCVVEVVGKKEVIDEWARTGGDKRVVWIANHQTFLDWWDLWLLTTHLDVDRSSDVKIILRADMASLPIYGWGMRMFEFIFVKFGRSAPATSFLDALLRNTSPSLPLTLILFPEGTLLYGSNQEKSVEYLRRELKLPSDAEVPYPYRNVLLPKSAGLHASFAALPNPPTQLWDFTIGYVGCRKPGTPAAGGAYPFDAIGPGAFHNGRQKVRRLAIHLRRWSADEIPGIAEGDEEASAEPTSSRTPSPSPSSASSATSPTSGAPAPPASFTSWLRDRFLEKDALMDSFYDTGHFPKVDPFIKNGEVEERSRLELPNETKMIMKLQPRTLWDVVWVLLMPVAIPVDFLINWIGGKWKDEKWGVQGRVKVE